MNWPVLLRAIASIAKYPLLMAAGAVIGLLWAGGCQEKLIGPVIAGSSSIRLEDTRAARRSEVVPSQECPQLLTLKPSKRERERLADLHPEDAQAPAPARDDSAPAPVTDAPPAERPVREWLAQRKMPRSAAGVIDVSWSPGHEVDVDFTPSRLSFPADVWVGPGLGVSLNPEDGDRSYLRDLHVRADLVQIGSRLMISPEFRHEFGHGARSDDNLLLVNVDLKVW